MVEEFEIKLDFRNKRPIAVQLQEAIRGLVQEGILQPGSQLPTVRNLAARLHINFNTVARVYRLLDREGIITTQQGRGSYVLEENPLSFQLAQPTHEEQVAKLVSELLEKAQRLQVSTMELQKELARAGRRVERKRQGNTHRKLRKEQRKYRVKPAWMRELRQAATDKSFRGDRKKTK
jgi:GntR family transcriptional regulator